MLQNLFSVWLQRQKCFLKDYRQCKHSINTSQFLKMLVEKAFHHSLTGQSKFPLNALSTVSS